MEAAKGWFLGSMVLLLLLLWNWQLVISGGAGIAAMVLVYLLLQNRLALPRVEWQVLWKPANRSLTLSIATGGVTCFTLYLILGIWQETGGSWLAQGVILQGLGTLAILLFLAWQWIERTDERTADCTSSVEQWLSQLADPDPLKRLIATRRLIQIAQSNATPLLATAELADCFRLMLNRETEPIVCRALVEGLQALNPDRQLSSSASHPLDSLSQPSVAADQHKLTIDR